MISKKIINKVHIQKCPITSLLAPKEVTQTGLGEIALKECSHLGEINFFFKWLPQKSLFIWHIHKVILNLPKIESNKEKNKF